MSQSTHLVKRLMCVVLALLMLLSMTACGEPASTNGSVATTGSNLPSSTQTTATIPSTGSQPTVPPTTVPEVPPTTLPEVPVDPEAYVLKYTLTQEEVDEYYRLLKECETLCLAGEDMEAVDASVVALEEMYAYLDAQSTVAMIFNYSHTADKDLEKQYLDAVDICTNANDAYLQMIKRVYQSDSPAKESLFEGWTQEDIDNLMSYDERIVELQQRNAQIGVEYRTSIDDKRKIQLYIEFVQNNNEIASFYGYTDYYTYAYEKVYSRDYSQNEVEQLRKFARNYMVDIFYRGLDNFYYSFYENIGNYTQVEVQDLLFADYDDLKSDYVGGYIDAAPENLSKALSNMLEHDSMFTDALDSKPGAFTTMIGERSYCYFGPGYWSSSTVMHEGGHYYASLYMDLGSIPLDLAEVHSQGNEWLFLRYLKDAVNSGVYNATVDYKLYEAMAMALICVMVDEFEQTVYTTDLTGFTAADLDAIMDQIALKYFPNGDVTTMLADMNNYWRMVVVEQPVYYISYAVSGIASLSLYTVADRDYDDAMVIYQKLCEEVDLEAGFLGNLKAAGLATPFDESFYYSLVNLVYGRGRD